VRTCAQATKVCGTKSLKTSALVAGSGSMLGLPGTQASCHMPFTVMVRGVSGEATAGVTLTIARSMGSDSLLVCARAQEGPSNATPSSSGRQAERKWVSEKFDGVYISTPDRVVFLLRELFPHSVSPALE
jgi:hypothetical protein